MNTLTLLIVLAVAVAIVAALVFSFRARPRDRLPLNAPPADPPSPPADPPLPLIELFVADRNGQQIVAFELNPNGSIPAQPTRAFGFNQPDSGLVNPHALVVNPAREIWVINRGALFVADPAPMSPNVPSISAYAGNTQGAAVAFRHFDSFVPPGGLFRTLENPVAVGWRNNPPALLVADTVARRLFEFTPDNPVPTGSIGHLVRPTGVCTDDLQRVYVSDQDPANPCVWRVPMHPAESNQTPIDQIAGAATLIRTPGHVAIDAQQNLYVVNEGNEFLRGDIVIFAPETLGNFPPIRRLFSTENSAVNWHHPRSVAVDSTGRVFVSANNRVMVFAADADGDATPIQVLEPATFGDVYGLSVR